MFHALAAEARTARARYPFRIARIRQKTLPDQIVQQGFDLLAAFRVRTQLLHQFGPGMLTAGQEPHGAALERYRRGHSNDLAATWGSDCGALFGSRVDADRGTDLVLDLARQLGTLLEKNAGVVFTLTDFLALVRIPGTGLIDDFIVYAEFQNLPFARDAFAGKDVEIRVLERWRSLVLRPRPPRLGANHFLTCVDRAGAANIQAHGGVELKRIPPGRGFRIAEHYPDLHADLVDENDQGVRTLDVAGELAQRLRHESRLQAHLRLAHFTFDFGFRHECRDRVDHNHVDGTGTHQHVGDFQRLLAIIRLGNEQVGNVDTELFRVLRIERVLRVDKCRHAAQLLHFSDHLQR